MPIARICHTCHTSFAVMPSDLARRVSLYCSPQCFHQSIRRSPLLTCVVCGTLFPSRASCVRWYCSIQCRNSPAALAHRLWRKIMLCSHGQRCPYCCWEWQGALSHEGYGLVSRRGQRRTSMQHAHRLAWEIHHRRPIADELVCAHYCHNRRCCNPWHLHCGTQKENMADSVRDKRRLGRRKRQSLDRERSSS
jgi:hypothetical protein